MSSVPQAWGDVDLPSLFTCLLCPLLGKHHGSHGRVLSSGETARSRRRAQVSLGVLLCLWAYTWKGPVLTRTASTRCAGQEGTVQCVQGEVRRSHRLIRKAAGAAGWDPRGPMNGLSSLTMGTVNGTQSPRPRNPNLPALGWLQIWASRGSCFALLSKVGTKLPCNKGIKLLRALVPLLKEEGRPRASASRNSPQHHHQQPTREAQGSTKGHLQKHTCRDGSRRRRGCGHKGTTATK